MRSLRIKGTEQVAHCNQIDHLVGFLDERGRRVTRFWVDDRHVYTVEESKRGPVFVRAKGYAA